MLSKISWRHYNSPPGPDRNDMIPNNRNSTPLDNSTYNKITSHQMLGNSALHREHEKQSSNNGSYHLLRYLRGQALPSNNSSGSAECLRSKHGKRFYQEHTINHLKR